INGTGTDNNPRGNRKLCHDPGEKRKYSHFHRAGHGVSGVISIADEIREDAKQAVTTLRQQGVEQIIMLTGDNEHTAKIVAEELGLDNYYAELLPENKVNYVKEWKDAGYHIAMAG